MNVERNFTYLNMGLSLCLVCNLGGIRGRFRRVFRLVSFRGVVFPPKTCDRTHRGATCASFGDRIYYAQLRNFMFISTQLRNL